MPAKTAAPKKTSSGKSKPASSGSGSSLVKSRSSFSIGQVSLIAAVVAVVGVAVVVFSHAATAPANTGNYLYAGRCLYSGQYFTSNGVDSHANAHPSKFVMQGDGNAVVYSSTGVVGFNTATTGSGNRICMQGDGNLVVYSATNKPLWQSHTGGLTSAAWNKTWTYAVNFATSTSTNIVITYAQKNLSYIPSDGGSFWTSNYGDTLWLTNNSKSPSGSGEQLMPQGAQLKSANGRYRLIFQTDGNLVLRNAAGTAVWSSGANSGKIFGNSYVNGLGPVLAAGPSVDDNMTAHAGPWYQPHSQFSTDMVKLVMQDDGNLVLRDNRNSALWQSYTTGK